MRLDSDGNEILYSIGEASRLARVTQAALRGWERAGLFLPRRTPGGHRLYTAQDLDRVRRINYLRRFERLNPAAIRRELGPSAESMEEPPAATGTLGPRLRALRLERGLALVDVARRTGLSVSFLSAVELGQVGISLGNLFKLSDVYDTTVAGLEAGDRRTPHQPLRAADRPRFVGDNGRVVIENLVTVPGSLKAHRFEIAPGGESKESYSHAGEEFVYIVSGQLTLWIDEREQHELHTGDSLYFRSRQPHSWRNEGSSLAIVLWTSTEFVDREFQALPAPSAAQGHRGVDGTAHHGRRATKSAHSR